MSTGTDVILCVILAMTKEAWGQHYENLSGRKTPPPVGNDKHDFKKGAKGSIGCCYWTCLGQLLFSDKHNANLNEFLVSRGLISER